MSRHRSRTRSAIIALLVLLVAAAPAGASQRDDLQAALDDVVAAGAPGVVALARDDSGTWAGAAGVADVATGRPLQPDLRFRVGSLAKPFVATVVLQLVDEGAIGLDQPVAAVLPGVLPDGDAITVRHLLQHTSGIPDCVAVLSDPERPARPPAGVAPRRARRRRRSRPPPLPAGRRLALQQHRLRPARHGRRVGRRRAPRAGAGRADHAPAGLDDTWRPVAARGLAAFQAALLGGGLLPPELLAEMRRTVDTGGEDIRYGLGLMEVDLPCGTAVGHDGGIAGCASVAVSLPDGGRDAVLLVNADATSALSAALWQGVASALCGSDAAVAPALARG